MQRFETDGRRKAPVFVCDDLIGRSIAATLPATLGKRIPWAWDACASSKPCLGTTTACRMPPIERAEPVHLQQSRYRALHKWSCVIENIHRICRGHHRRQHPLLCVRRARYPSNFSLQESRQARASVSPTTRRAHCAKHRHIFNRCNYLSPTRSVAGRRLTCSLIYVTKDSFTGRYAHAPGVGRTNRKSGLARP